MISKLSCLDQTTHIYIDWLNSHHYIAKLIDHFSKHIIYTRTETSLRYGGQNTIEVYFLPTTPIFFAFPSLRSSPKRDTSIFYVCVCKLWFFEWDHYTPGFLFYTHTSYNIYIFKEPIFYEPNFMILHNFHELSI